MAKIAGMRKTKKVKHVVRGFELGGKHRDPHNSKKVAAKRKGKRNLKRA